MWILRQKYVSICKIWGSHSGSYDIYSVLWCYTMSIGRKPPNDMELQSIMQWCWGRHFIDRCKHVTKGFQVLKEVMLKIRAFCSATLRPFSNRHGLISHNILIFFVNYQPVINNFDRGHPVVLLLTIIYISNRLTQYLLYVFTYNDIFRGY